MHKFVMCPLNLVYCYCLQKNHCERNCFILKDVKFTEIFYSTKFDFSAEIQNFFEYFYLLNLNFNADFQGVAGSTPAGLSTFFCWEW